MTTPFERWLCEQPDDDDVGDWTPLRRLLRDLMADIELRKETHNGDKKD